MNVCKRNVLIICEGLEEWHYIKKLLSFPFYNNELYSFAEPINVKGNENIFPRFQNEYNKGRYDLILIFCDGDNNSLQFQNIKNQIDNNIFGVSGIAERFIIFVNPVTLQVVLSHFADIKLTHKSKKANSKIVEEVTGITNYDAKEEQIIKMINNIHFRSYEEMKRRIEEISTSISDSPSTNFLNFLKKFESDSTDWIDDIY